MVYTGVGPGDGKSLLGGSGSGLGVWVWLRVLRFFWNHGLRSSGLQNWQLWYRFTVSGLCSIVIEWFQVSKQLKTSAQPAWSVNLYKTRQARLQPLFRNEREVRSNKIGKLISDEI